MATYVFQCDRGLAAVSRPIEVELDSVREAQIEAVQFLGEILKGRPERFWEYQEARMIVSDGAGLTLFTLDLAAILAPTMRPDGLS